MKWRLFIAALLWGGVFSAYPVQGGFLEFGNHGVGSLSFPDEAVADDDHVLVVFSDSLLLDPALKEHTPFNLPMSGIEPVAECLSVAQISLLSDRDQLQAPAILTFRCEQIPSSSAVYGWINGDWILVPAVKRSDNNVSVEVIQATTYALFPQHPGQGPLSQI